MKLVFAGTPEFAVPALEALHAAGHDIIRVVTQPDRPRGRGMKLTPPAVKVAAEELHLPVEQPQKMRGDAGHGILAACNPDAVVIVAYGEIIPGDLLSIPRFGWINLHASLLPRYRGAAPIQWALIHGETVTGVTTMQIDAGMDSGPTLLQREVAIEPGDTTPTLSEKLSRAGAPLLVETLAGLESGELRPTAQDHSRATKAPLLKKEHGRVDWNLTAAQIHNRVRGLQPWPIAFTEFRGQRLRLWKTAPAETAAPVAEPGMLQVSGERLWVGCGGRTRLELEEVQLASHKRLAAREFLNGLHIKSGEQLGS